MESDLPAMRSLAQLAADAILLIRIVGTSPEATEATISATFSTSTRRLQRALAGAGTTFRTEQLKARMAFAEARLAEGNRPLAWIATGSGYAHPAAFSRAFKRAHGGTTPLEWRAKHRMRRLGDQSLEGRLTAALEAASDSRRRQLEHRFNHVANPRQ